MMTTLTYAAVAYIGSQNIEADTGLPFFLTVMFFVAIAQDILLIRYLYSA